MPSAIPNLPPLTGIKDPAVRTYLEALTNAWAVRNGYAGDGKEKFLTVKDLTDGINTAITRVSNGNVTGNGGSGGGNGVGGALTPLLGWLANSALWKHLQSRIEDIETPEWFRSRFGRQAQAGIRHTETVAAGLAKVLDEAIAELNGNLSGVTREINAVVDESQSMATRLENVFAQYKNGYAEFNDNVQVLVDSDKAMAEAFREVFAEYNGNLAAVRDTLSTVVDSQKSFATKTSQVLAQFAGNLAYVFEQTKAMATSTTSFAEKSTTLKAQVNGQNGTLTVLQNQLQKVEADVAGNFKNIWSVRMEAIPGATGRYYAAGFGLGMYGNASDGNVTSDFIINANNFAFINATEPNKPIIYPFTITSKQDVGAVIGLSGKTWISELFSYNGIIVGWGNGTSFTVRPEPVSISCFVVATTSIWCVADSTVTVSLHGSNGPGIASRSIYVPGGTTVECTVSGIVSGVGSCSWAVTANGGTASDTSYTYIAFTTGRFWGY